MVVVSSQKDEVQIVPGDGYVIMGKKALLKNWPAYGGTSIERSVKSEFVFFN